ncbi:Brain-enriched guanylate kinase-associated protein, partial [Ophiophagus hannah]
MLICCALCLSSTLQEQKGELCKRLSYTTHKLEMLETEFDSTRQYLEVELRRAQEELEKVTEKLRRIQNNYLALQRINQDLEDKLYRMVSTGGYCMIIK